MLCSNTLFFTITEENLPKQVDDLGSQFTEIFIKQQENVTLLLTLVEVSNSIMLGALRDMSCRTGRSYECVKPRFCLSSEACVKCEVFLDVVKVGLEVSEGYGLDERH